MRFRNFVNNFSKRNRIYSDEDMYNMSLGNIFDNEDELYSQYQSIGFPQRSELEKSPNVQWVEPYTTLQGNQDGGYYQSVLEPEYKTPVGSIIEQNLPQVAGFDNKNNSSGLLNLLQGQIGIKPDFELGVEKNVYAEPQTTSMPSVVQNQNIPNPNINGISQDELSGILERMLKLPYLNNANINQELGKNEQNSERMDLLQGLWNDYKGIQDPTTAIMYALGAFISNYKNMKDANTIGADKYFHAKANYEAAQQGIVGSTVAKIISDLRELTDSYRNIHEKGYTPEFSKQDSKEDQNANIEGRNLGFKYSTKPASLMLKHLIPKGLPKRYRKY